MVSSPGCDGLDEFLILIRRARRMLLRRPRPSSLCGWFQSSSAAHGGCYRRPPWQPRRKRRFNPHPPLGADATSCTSRSCPRLMSFQSSSAPRSGCNEHGGQDGHGYGEFQSSSAPRSGCYVMPHTGRPVVRCFNPHPPLGADATSLWLDRISSVVSFQSSSAPRSGCYRRKLTPSPR